MAIQRVRVTWTGFTGAPGISTFYCMDAAALRAPLGAFFNDLRVALPTTVTNQIQATGDTLDEATGEITSAWATAPSATTQGTDAAAYPAPAGAVIEWFTGGVVHSHRVRGRTFLVPGGGSIYQADGTLLDGPRTVITDAASAFVAATTGNLVVWARPFKGRAATATRPAIPARQGSRHQVLSSSVPDKAVVLRSRRD